MHTPPMPGKLVAVLILLSLNVISNLYTASQPTGGGGANYVGIAFNVALIAGLIMGREWARVLAKVVAVLSLVLGVLALVVLMGVSSALASEPPLLAIMYAGVGLSLFLGGFMLWTMNQADVLEWLTARSLARA
jgi:hypothetical protein